MGGGEEWIIRIWLRLENSITDDPSNKKKTKAVGFYEKKAKESMIVEREEGVTS